MGWGGGLILLFYICMRLKFLITINKDKEKSVMGENGQNGKP